MGELIKVLHKTKIKNMEVDIELNHPPAEGLPRDIHLQNKAFRLDLGERDFIQMAAPFGWARKRFLASKGVSGDE